MRGRIGVSRRCCWLFAAVVAGVAAFVLAFGSESTAAGSASAVGGVRGCAAAVRLPDRPLRIGVVFTGPPTAGVDAIVYRGFRQAVRELGIEGKVLVQGPKEDGAASLSYLARQGYDLVVAGVLHVPVLEKVARQFSRTCFLLLDAPLEVFMHKPTNVQGLVFHVEQPSYLAGYLAASVERERPGKHVVSTVGGLSFPPVNMFIAGFQAGARKADPSVTLLNDYSRNFNNPAPCRRLALQQITRGSGVVFQVAGLCGVGVLQAAKEKGVWGIGVDEDQSALGPQVLTSVVKNYDVGLFQAIRSLQRGTFRTGTTVAMGLRNDAVGLGKISPRVPRTLIAKLEHVREQIIAGRIAVPQKLKR